MKYTIAEIDGPKVGETTVYLMGDGKPVMGCGSYYDDEPPLQQRLSREDALYTAQYYKQKREATE